METGNRTESMTASTGCRECEPGEVRASSDKEAYATQADSLKKVYQTYVRTLDCLEQSRLLLREIAARLRRTS